MCTGDFEVICEYMFSRNKKKPILSNWSQILSFLEAGNITIVTAVSRRSLSLPCNVESEIKLILLK